MDILAPYIAPLLAIVGSLTVALVGLYQWRHQHADPKRAASAEASRRAHEHVWQCLEEINLELREFENFFELKPSLDEKLKQVNAVFIKNSLYFSDSDQKEIVQYVKAFDHLRAVITAWEDGELRRDFAMTLLVWSDSRPSTVMVAPPQTVPKSSTQRENGAIRPEAHITPVNRQSSDTMILTHPDELRKAKAEVRRLRETVKRRMQLGAGVQSRSEA